MSALACSRHSSCQFICASQDIVTNLRGKRSALTYIFFGKGSEEFPDARKKSPGATNALLNAKDSRDGRTPFSTGDEESNS
jgi:hypothetical protein